MQEKYYDTFINLRDEVVDSINSLILRFGDKGLKIPNNYGGFIEAIEHCFVTKDLQFVSYHDVDLGKLCKIFDILFEEYYRYSVDPDSGWKYGFPKELPKGFDVNNHDEVMKFIKDNGFPHEVITYRIF